MPRVGCSTLSKESVSTPVQRGEPHDFGVFRIKKVISWTLPTNAGEAMTIVVALFLGMALPITAVQILWVQQVFDTRAVPLLDGLLIVSVGIVFFAVIETEKQLRLVVRQKRRA